MATTHTVRHEVKWEGNGWSVIQSINGLHSATVGPFRYRLIAEIAMAEMVEGIDRAAEEARNGTS